MAIDQGACRGCQLILTAAEVGATVGVGRRALIGTLVAVAVVAAAFVLFRGAPSTPASVSGFPVGGTADCSSGTLDCADAIRAATEALNTREPSHPAIQSAAVHELGQSASSERRSQALVVVLFALSDGTAAAAGATCGVGSCQPVETYQ